MRGEGRPLVLERLGALGLLLALTALTAWSASAPLREAWGGRAIAQERLARHHAALAPSTEQARRFDPGAVAGEHRDDAEAQLALQSALDRAMRATGVGAQTIQPLAAEALGELGRAVWVEVSVETDLQGLVELLGVLDRERPLVLLRALDVQAGGGPRPDAELRVRLEAGRAWRAAGGPS